MAMILQHSLVKVLAAEMSIFGDYLFPNGECFFVFSAVDVALRLFSRSGFYKACYQSASDGGGFAFYGTDICGANWDISPRRTVKRAALVAILAGFVGTMLILRLGVVTVG
jgi:hypothetical protein